MQIFKIILAIIINLFNLLFFPLGDFLFAFCYAAPCMYNNGMHKEKRKRKRKSLLHKHHSNRTAKISTLGTDLEDDRIICLRKRISLCEGRIWGSPGSPTRFTNQLQVFWSLCFNHLFRPRPYNLPDLMHIHTPLQCSQTFSLRSQQYLQLFLFF